MATMTESITQSIGLSSLGRYLFLIPVNHLLNLPVLVHAAPTFDEHAAQPPVGGGIVSDSPAVREAPVLAPLGPHHPDVSALGDVVVSHLQHPEEEQDDRTEDDEAHDGADTEENAVAMILVVVLPHALGQKSEHDCVHCEREHDDECDDVNDYSCHFLECSNLF